MHRKAKRILFVDDEPAFLELIRKTVRSAETGWRTSFARSGKQALALLNDAPFDVLVSDIQMPGVSGQDLLEETAKRCPETVRVAVSGFYIGPALRSVGPAHRYLTKPCDTDSVIGAVEHGLALRDLLSAAPVTETIAQLGELPRPPALYLRLVEELRSSEPSICRAANIITGDPAMSKSLLTMANSAYFGFRHRVSDVRQAVTLLGLRTTKDLVLSTEVFSQFLGQDFTDLSLDAADVAMSGYAFREFGGGQINTLPVAWVVDHSLSTAAIARNLAEEEGHEHELADDAFMAGSLHDVGQLILANRLGERYAETLATAAESQRPLWQAEYEVLGTSHAEVGAYLMRQWGLPDVVVEAMAYHHQPQACGERALSPLILVHAADALHHEMRPKLRPWPAPQMAPQCLAELGLTGRMERWRVGAAGLLGR